MNNNFTNKALIYELFSGVGFCNQIFSLETAIYLANISNRKLILLIRNPLCHCGHANWNFGKFLDLFSDNYLKYLPNGFEVYYGSPSTNITNIINNNNITKTLNYKARFSSLVFVDSNLDNEKNKEHLQNFLKGRQKENLNFENFNNYQYFYLPKDASNASRCFYNFYTTIDNYILMNNIAKSLTLLKPNINNIFNKIILPEKFIGIHFRFGDQKHDTESINKRTSEYTNNLDINFISNLKLPIIIMCDRKDSPVLELFKKNNIKILFTDELILPFINEIKQIFKDFNKTEVIQFLIERKLMEKSLIFYANKGSTVSHYINYIRYINNLNYYNLYSNSKDKIIKNNNLSWINNSGEGHIISWHSFWSENVYKNISNYKLITLTNNGYKLLTENLLFSMKQCGIMHLLKIYCLDIDCYNYFKNKYIYNDIELVKLINSDDSKFSKWIEYKAVQSQDIEGKKDWANITKYKIIIINNELRKGNDVIFIDGDIIIFNNFIQDLYDQIYDKDLLIQNDNESVKTAAMCTGFFLMKSNERTIECTNFNNINMEHFPNDQQYLRSCQNKISSLFLDLDKYPNGKYYRENLPKNPNIIHFNYDSGEQKLKRIQGFKYWYIENNDYFMKFSSWLSFNFPKKEIIINSSVKDGSDSFTTLTIGIQHDYLKYIFNNNNNNEFLKHPEINSKLCLSAFRRSTDKDRRSNLSINRNTISNNISNKNFISVFQSDSISYFKEIGKYKFVICPEGNGIDTHRLWETLYSKGIPIVEDNELMRKKCEGLPILWTKDYSELTEEYLNQKYEEILNTEYDFSQLYLSFYNKERKIELLDRSKFWCNKRGLGELFYKYYDIDESIIEINNMTIIDNIPNSKNGNKYHGLNDCDGIPMDRKLDELFNKKEKGIFIDVGAHNGIEQSNTLFLENYRNWTGILITPNKQKYDECKINRPKSTCECYACVSPDYKLSTVKGDFWKLEGSIDATRSKSNHTEPANCSTLTHILEKNFIDFKMYFNKNLETEIDLLKIDTGAFEYEVLLGLNLSRFKPLYILVEILNHDYDKIIKYLLENGYKLECNFSNFTKEKNKRWDGTHNDYLFKRENNLNNHFSQDKFTAFYINMDKDITRKEHCEKLLNDIGFNNIERIIPIDKNDEQLLKSEIDCVCSKNLSAFKNKNELSYNKIGGKNHGKPEGFKSLTNTHKKIWEKIIKLNTDDYYFIFEDDIELVTPIERSKFLNILINDIKKMPKLNDLIYLGSCLENQVLSDPNVDFNNVSCWGAHAYMINKKGCQYIFDNILCWHQCADYILRSLFKTNIFGSQHHCPYNKGHIGYLFQGRKEPWYTTGMDEIKFGVKK
jgi:hypothetical protein